MPRGPLSPETKKLRALKLAEAFLGKEIEVPEPPLENLNDLMREAQSVLYYFETGGAGFTKKQCKTCEEYFVYCWNVKGVSYCSVTCMDRALKKIGLKWDPTKPPEQRWGKTVPAVVPASVLFLLDDIQKENQQQDQSVDTLEDLLGSITDE
jgi:hypothetical protein